MIWTPKNEVEKLKKIKQDILERRKKLDLGFLAMLQFSIEKGDFDNFDPIIKWEYSILAFGKTN